MAKSSRSAGSNRLPREPADSTPMSDRRADRVAVLLPRPLSRTFDYRVDRPVPAGTYVSVPFGKRIEVGVVWGAATGEVPESQLRNVLAVSDLPPMTPRLRELLGWVASYAMAPLGSVLKMAIPVAGALMPARAATGYRLAEPRPEGARLTPARQRVLEVLAGAGSAMAGSAVQREAHVSAATVQRMHRAGFLAPEPLAAATLPGAPYAGAGPELSAAQRRAAGTIVRRVQARDARPVLLGGVTGSGKTEVYFEAVAACLASGRQVLVLLPEIALGPQWLARFEARFGTAPARWHSAVPGSERRRTWRGVAAGTVPVVVGARSALFLPFPSLGLIVVDEEHDASYKQEDGVTYNARDMAVVRAAKEGAAIVLASATPSLETHVNACEGRYHALALPRRYGGAELPDIEAVDLREHRPEAGSWLSGPLVDAVATALERGEQALLFLNRRGYAPLTVCRTCGGRIGCTACSTWLVEHRRNGVLACHHCGHRIPVPEVCPTCGVADSLTACGPGVERIEAELRRRFPAVDPAVMTSDTMRGPADVARLVRSMEAGTTRILVGTQMAAKGHHFPRLTVVGVVDADLGLGGADLRAGERTYQLLTQVAGRAGRADLRGRVLMQTWEPAHPVMQAFLRGDGPGFLQMEAAARAEARMPPYGRLVALVLTARDSSTLERFGRALARVVPPQEGVEVFGPAPAPLGRIRGRYRARFLVRGGRDRRLQAYVRTWLGSVRVPAQVRIKVDVDPYSFL